MRAVVCPITGNKGEPLERVRKRFSRMLPELRSISYKKRHNRLILFSVKFQRLVGNLIEIYKLMRGIDRVDSFFFSPGWKYQIF